MRNRLFLGFSNRHKFALVAAILTIFILFNTLPSPTSKLDPRTDKSYGEDRPRYLHQSTFRTNPDYEYEVKISNALRAIEIERGMRHDEDAADTLWQIMLPGAITQRSDDSIQFEKKNSEWRYRVRPTIPVLIITTATNFAIHSSYKLIGPTNSFMKPSNPSQKSPGSTNHTRTPFTAVIFSAT
jgi:hypothetical protein